MEKENRGRLEWKMRQALCIRQAKRKPKVPKPQISEKWYRKNPVTINSKLRQAIIDHLPLEMDKKQADLILRIIFDTIVEGVKRDGFVTIPFFGRFYKQVRIGRYYSVRQGNPRNPRKKNEKQCLMWRPEQHTIGFRFSARLKQEVNEALNGNSGTD